VIRADPGVASDGTTRPLVPASEETVAVDGALEVQTASSVTSLEVPSA